MKGLVKGQVEANLLSDASSRLQPFESQGNERNCWGRIVAFHWTVSPLFSSSRINQINLWFEYGGRGRSVGWRRGVLHEASFTGRDLCFTALIWPITHSWFTRGNTSLLNSHDVSIVPSPALFIPPPIRDTWQFFSAYNHYWMNFCCSVSICE